MSHNLQPPLCPRFGGWREISVSSSVVHMIWGVVCGTPCGGPKILGTLKTETKDEISHRLDLAIHFHACYARSKTWRQPRGVKRGVCKRDGDNKRKITIVASGQHSCLWDQSQEMRGGGAPSGDLSGHPPSLLFHGPTNGRVSVYPVLQQMTSGQQLMPDFLGILSHVQLPHTLSCMPTLRQRLSYGRPESIGPRENDTL